MNMYSIILGTLIGENKDEILDKLHDRLAINFT